MKNKDRVVFFASGDFAVETLDKLVQYGVNIVGVVTSNDKVKFNQYRIEEIAKKYRIPCYSVLTNNLEDDYRLENFLTKANADIFCVISFKKLPAKIIKLAKKYAFNVHASLLPYYRGAAPIEAAICNMDEETGLTAFFLTDKIDAGDIIANTRVKIAPNDGYTSLFKKLSKECVEFTFNVIEEVLTISNIKDLAICQLQKCHYIEAEKIDKKYFIRHWLTYATAKALDAQIKAVDDRGYNCTLSSRELSDDGIREFKIKIFEGEVCEEVEGNCGKISTDGKTYLRINCAQCSYNVTKIQLAGKKPMDIRSFLNGFRYADPEKYYVTISPGFDEN